MFGSMLFLLSCFLLGFNLGGLVTAVARQDGAGVISAVAWLLASALLLLMSVSLIDERRR